jgi:hypothetical protein
LTRASFLSYALLERREETARVRAELLAAYPSISAELLLNQGWIVARPEEEALCASDADLAQIVQPRRLAECAKQSQSKQPEDRTSGTGIKRCDVCYQSKAAFATMSAACQLPLP